MLRYRAAMEDPRRLDGYHKAIQLERDVHKAVMRFPLHYRRKTGVHTPTHRQLNDQVVEVKRMIAGLIRKLDERDRGPID